MKDFSFLKEKQKQTYSAYTLALYFNRTLNMSLPLCCWSATFP